MSGETKPAAKPRKFNRAAIIADLIENGYDQAIAPAAVDCFLNPLSTNPAMAGRMSQGKDQKQFGSFCFFQGFAAGFVASGNWN